MGPKWLQDGILADLRQLGDNMASKMARCRQDAGNLEATKPILRRLKPT